VIQQATDALPVFMELHYMKTSKIILLASSLIVIFFSSFPQVEAAIEKELDAKVAINIRWDKDDHKGFMQFRCNGKLIVNEDFSSTKQLESPRAVFIPYRFQQASASVSYESKIIDKNPPEGAPEIITMYEYSGPVKIKTGIAPGPLVIHHLGSILEQLREELKQQGMGDMEIPIPDQAKSSMTDNYQFALPTEKVHLKGKERHYRTKCCDANGEHYKEWYYKDVEKDITLGSLKLQKIQIGDDGKLSGNKSWEADARLFNPALTGGGKDLFPSSPKEDAQGGVSYSVTWSFGKQQAPLVEIQSVAFNTGENKKKEIVLQLYKLSTLGEIYPPEWIKGKKNKPAALILGQPFKVKAVLKVEKGIKKAKVWAEEEVIKGNGGFGGIDKKEVDVENGKIVAEFSINTPQDFIGINEVRWIWKAQDQTDGKEKTDIEAGVSDHKIFIIGPGPNNKILDADYNKFVYIVRIGCERAEGTKGGGETFNKIWKKFWNIEAPGGGGILAYRHTKPEVYDTRDLLNLGHGRCKAWQEFFYDTMACQGIKTEKVGVKPIEPLDIMVVKKQPAQGNPNPDRVFFEHALNAYDGNYYDPSYRLGPISRDNGPQEYENTSFVAYCECPGEKCNAIRNEAISKSIFNKILPGTFNSCGDLLFGDNSGMAQLADCLSQDENAHCVPNDIDLCEVVEY
jgi:hypothetical protein